MNNLKIPDGLKVAEVVSDNLEHKDNYLEYLAFTEKKFEQITLEVLTNIIQALGQGRSVNLVIPLNGGLLFYRKLMNLIRDNQFYTNSINVIFAAKDSDKKLRLSGNPENVDTAYNIAIDDIWDRGGTGSNIVTEFEHFGKVSRLEYFAFCIKEDSPMENNRAVLGNPKSAVVYPEEWLHGWGGMDSSLFKTAYITALERTSYIPLIPSKGNVKFNPANAEHIKLYTELLVQTNLSINGVIPLEVFNDVLFLEQTPNFEERFNYLKTLHNQYLRIDSLNVVETVEVEG